MKEKKRGRDMFGIGFQEMIIILVVVLIFFGPKRLPDLAKSLGKGLAEFKKASAEVRKGIDEAVRAADLDEPGTRNELRGPAAAYRAPGRTAQAVDPFPDRMGGRNRPVLFPRGFDLPGASLSPDRTAPVGLPAHFHRTHRGFPHLLQAGSLGRVCPGKPRDLLPGVAFRRPRPLPERTQDSPSLFFLVDCGPPCRNGVRVLCRGPFDLLLLSWFRGIDHCSDAVDEGVPLAGPADPSLVRSDVRGAAGPVPRGAGGNPDPGTPAPREGSRDRRRVSPRSGPHPPECRIPGPRRPADLRPVRGGDPPVRPWSRTEQGMRTGVERTAQIHYSRVGA